MAASNWLAATTGQSPLANQINQFLQTHASTVVYTGAQRDNQSTAGSGAVNSNGLWIAQKFTAAGTYTSGRIVLTLAATGSPAPWTVSIQADNAGAPSGTALASVTLPNGFVPAAAGTVSMPLSASIASGSVYWIVAQAAGDVSDFYAWSKSNQLSGASTSANGTTWSTQAYGLLFQVWDNTVVQPLVHTWGDSGARWTSEAYAATGALAGVKEYTTAQGNSYTQSAATFGYANGLPSSVTQGASANATPAWSAARSGLLGDTGAVNTAAQINQLLGTHASQRIYQGNKILTPAGTGGGFSGLPLKAYDKCQPFTMSGTTIGRVALPVVPFGSGADLVVSLCADSAGTPGTVITQTRVPATWFQALSAYTAIDATNPVQLTATNSPLATAASNTFTMGNVVSFAWNTPTPSGGPSSKNPGFVTNGQNVIVFFGGINAANNYVTDVSTILDVGAQALNAPVPQAAMPTGNGTYAASTVTTDPSSGDQYVIIAGGETGNSGSYTTVSTVYASALTPSTGALSSWSAQTSLPQSLQTATAAASGNYVYVVGGVTPSNTILNTVYWANVQNGQIQSWNTGPALPVPVYSAYTAVSNGFLFVIGGYTATGLTNPTNAVWYAPIHSDGTLGSWQPGPPMPYPNTNGAGAYAMTMSSTGAILVRGYNTQGLFSLPVTSTGPGTAWQQQAFPGIGSDALLPSGTGQWYWFEGFNSATTYTSAGFILCPYLSVPLAASGLTNGATYHIVLQQPGGTTDLNNYLGTVLDFNVFPGNPVLLNRARGSTTWTTGTAAIPLTIYDNSNANAAANGATGTNQVLHTWEDSGARITTLVRATTPDQRLIGYCEATTQPGPVLNSNPTFTNGTAPWGAAGGTLTQSSAQTHGSLPFSGLLTPTGSASQSYIESELLPVTLQQPYTANAWVYSPTGYANAVIQINWYTSTGLGGYISSTTGATTSLAAGTWTQLSATATQPPATAVYATVAVYEKGTPPASALLYNSAVTLQNALGPQISSAAQITYPGTWPGTGLWPPTGVNVLA